MEPLTLIAIIVLAMSIVGTAITSVICNLAASELYDWAPRLANWLVSRAVAKLRDPEDRVDYIEQFQADLADVPGHNSKLLYAFRIFWNRLKLARDVEGWPPQVIDRTVLRRAGKWASIGMLLWAGGNCVATFAPGSRIVGLAANYLLFQSAISLLYVLYLRTKLYKKLDAS